MHGGSRKGAGRKAGGKNSRTVEREERLVELAEKVSGALGIESFRGDAHELLMLTYKDTSHPLNVRIDAAKAAIPYEKPRLASIEADVNVALHEMALEELE